MKHINIILLTLIVIIILFNIFCEKIDIEHLSSVSYSFVSDPEYEFNYFNPLGYIPYRSPFNPLRHTKNMSYDLRGDIPPI